MPTYQYRPAKSGKGCTYCKPGFEIVQRMSDDTLTKCPKCHKAIERVFSGCNINTKLKSAKSLMTDSSLKRLGFSKLVKDGEGKYRKLF